MRHQPVKVFRIFADAVELAPIDAFNVFLASGHIEESISPCGRALTGESLRNHGRSGLFRRRDVVVVIVVVPFPALWRVGIPHAVVPRPLGRTGAPPAVVPSAVVVSDGRDGVGFSGGRSFRCRRFRRPSSDGVRSSSGPSGRSRASSSSSVATLDVLLPVASGDSAVPS